DLLLEVRGPRADPSLDRPPCASSTGRPRSRGGGRRARRAAAPPEQGPPRAGAARSGLCVAPGRSRRRM
ncbi:MAG: hypothetical protein AVDCRST_MAG10-2259, partial [uncultured Acidimicrobiales bacterium]